MTARELGRVAGPVVGLAVVGALFGLLLGPTAGWWWWVGLLTGVGLMVPAAVAAGVAARWLAGKARAGAAVGFLVGTAVRSTVLLLGGLAAFLLAGGRAAGRADVLIYWGWLLAAYLVALAAEVVALRGRARPPNGNGGKG